MDRITGLLLYLRIVETGSFSKAAADTGITQPTATKQVAALETRLGARLLHRSTRGVTTTEIGARYYEKCKQIARDLEEADNLAALLQSKVGGTLRISTSVAFGQRVLVPLALRFMREHPDVTIDLSFEDRYVDLIEHGIDLAIRLGRLADSSLGARSLGQSPWLTVAAPAYLACRGVPQSPADLAEHDCLIYTSVQGDDRWPFAGGALSVPVKGPLRSNNLSALLVACRAGLGVAVLPWYLAGAAVAEGALQAVLEAEDLPPQDMHAVFPSPRLVPGKVQSFIEFLLATLQDDWWRRPL